MNKQMFGWKIVLAKNVSISVIQIQKYIGGWAGESATKRGINCVYDDDQIRGI